MQALYLFGFKVLSLVGAVLSIVAIVKRSYSNGTYTFFMVVQSIGFAYTGWLLGAASVFVTVAALLLTRSDT